MTKKLLSLLLSATLLFSATACARTVQATDDGSSILPTTETMPTTDVPENGDQDGSAPYVQELPDPTDAQTDTTQTDAAQTPSAASDGSTAPDTSAQRVLDPEKPMVALTFDDGPHATHTDEVLDILEANGAVATFFQVGRNLYNDPDAVRRAEAMGCEIGSHSYRHANLSTMSADAIAADLEKADAAFVEVLGHAPNLLRPPYGSMNKAVKSTTGRSIITWSIDTEDWRSRDTEKIVSVVQGVSDLNGQVILMHDVYDTTVEAARILVPWLLEQGYQLVTVSELITLHYQDEVLANGLYGYSYFTYGKSVILPEGATPEPSKPADSGTQTTPAEPSKPNGSGTQTTPAEPSKPAGSGTQTTPVEPSKPNDSGTQATPVEPSNPNDSGAQGATSQEPSGSQDTTTQPPTSSGSSDASQQPPVQPDPEDPSGQLT